MTQQNALTDYILSQKNSGVSNQEIAQQLKLSGYSDDQINQAVYGHLSTNSSNSVIGENQSTKKKSASKFILPVIFLFIGLLTGTAFGHWLSRENSPTPVENQPQQDLEITNNDPSTICGQYYDVGYIKGLYGKSIDDQRENVVVPSLCEELHVQGFEAGKQSASEQYASYDDVIRRQDLMLIAQAVYQFAVANNGNLPVDISSTPKIIGKLDGYADIQQELTEFLDMSGDDRVFPYDPDGGSLESTKYTIFTNQEGRLVLQANSSENPSQLIEIIR